MELELTLRRSNGTVILNYKVNPLVPFQWNMGNDPAIGIVDDSLGAVLTSFAYEPLVVAVRE